MDDPNTPTPAELRKLARVRSFEAQGILGRMAEWAMAHDVQTPERIAEVRRMLEAGYHVALGQAHGLARAADELEASRG